MKKALMIILSVVVLLGAMIGGNKIHINSKQNAISSTVYEIKKPFSDYELKEEIACYLFDTSNIYQLTGYVDYVFVANIEELIGTTYRDVYCYPDGSVSASPFTNYKIKVLYNIKGNLDVNSSIPVSKYGGVNYDQKSISCSVSDLPEVGKTYVLFGYADENGEIYLEPSSNVIIDDFDISNPTQGGIATYIKAYENEDLSVTREPRYISKYELKSASDK